MNSRSLIGLSLIACVSLAGAQGERNDTRKAAESLFAKFDAAINKGNNTSVWGMFAPDYYMVDLQGKRKNLTEFRADMAATMAACKDVQVNTQIKNVQLQNTEMVVWTQEQIKFTIQVEGKWQPMVKTMRWAETLRMVNGEWKFSSSQQLMTNEPWTFKTTG